MGLLHAGFWARDEGPRQERKKRSAEEKESHKWVVGLRAVEERLPSEQEVVVIADREGDVFDLFTAPRRSNVHLLVRVAHPRNVELMEGEGSVRMSLLEAAAAAPVVGEMTVKVSRQEGRPERDARLEVRTARVKVAVPYGLRRPIKLRIKMRTDWGKGNPGCQLLAACPACLCIVGLGTGAARRQPTSNGWVGGVGRTPSPRVQQ